MRILPIIIIFLIIGALIIVIGYSIDLEEKQGKKTFLNIYGKWLLKLGGNIKNLAGFTIKQDWLPDINKSINVSNMTKYYIIEGE